MKREQNNKLFYLFNHENLKFESTHEAIVTHNLNSWIYYPLKKMYFLCNIDSLRIFIFTLTHCLCMGCIVMDHQDNQQDQNGISHQWCGNNLGDRSWANRCHTDRQNDGIYQWCPITSPIYDRGGLKIVKNKNLLK